MVHVLIYVVLLGMTAGGIGMLALSGAGPIRFGGAEGPLPDFLSHRPRIAHGIGARVFIALLVLHVGAALHHHVVRKDALSAGTWFRRSV